MSDSGIGDAVDPDAAFSILSDDTRIEILQALWDAENREATFSELQEAVGMRDSGQFNYHLGKFDGQFVAETNDGYRLTNAGAQLIGALLTGAYTKTIDVTTVNMNDSCPRCESSLKFTYEDGKATISCEDCTRVHHFLVPPGAFAGYATDEFPQVAARYGRQYVLSSLDGFCPLCDGQVQAAVLPVADAIDADVETVDEIPTWVDRVPTCEFTCDRCGEGVVVDLGTTLVEHPAVVSFYYERGVDVRRVPIWRHSALDPDKVRFESRDPIQASVTYEVDSDQLTVTVDDSLSVIETTTESS